MLDMRVRLGAVNVMYINVAQGNGNVSTNTILVGLMCGVLLL